MSRIGKNPITIPAGVTLSLTKSKVSAKGPKGELVVFKEYETVGVYDENNEPVLNADGSPRFKIIKDSTIYFRWNGTELSQIK